MSEQPKPTDAQSAMWVSPATAINAAIDHAVAVERENVRKLGEQYKAEIHLRIDLEQQLAAERSKVQMLTAALREVNALARGNMTGCGTCNHVIDATIKVL